MAEGARSLSEPYTKGRGAGGIEMNAKQTPIEDIMRCYAEDLHSTTGHNRYSNTLSQGADEIERLRAALEIIASPMRPDGTWNRDREACQQLAEKVLRS